MKREEVSWGSVATAARILNMVYDGEVAFGSGDEYLVTKVGRAGAPGDGVGLRYGFISC